MSTLAEQRRIRLKNDHQSMVNISRSWLSWKGTKGQEPYFEEYNISLNIRTLVGDEQTYQNNHKISVILPASYPHTSAPQITYLGHPSPFHPNWYTNGRWCSGDWLFHESLGAHVVRLIQTLQYDKDITNEGSAANAIANSWYKGNKGKRLFPTDNTELPDPTTGRLRIKPIRNKKKFIVSG